MFFYYINKCDINYWIWTNQLKNKASISKNCTRHNEVEDIKKTRHSGHNGLEETKYKITKKDVLDKVEKKEED